jgi:hypothetical protein
MASVTSIHKHNMGFGEGRPKHIYVPGFVIKSCKDNVCRLNARDLFALKPKVTYAFFWLKNQSGPVAPRKPMPIETGISASFHSNPVSTREIDDACPSIVDVAHKFEGTRNNLINLTDMKETLPPLRPRKFTHIDVAHTKSIKVILDTVANIICGHLFEFGQKFRTT